MRGSRFIPALMACMAGPLALPNPAAAGDRVVDYAATPSKPELVEYIAHASSKKGGNCCLWADGYLLGKEYLLVDLSSGEKTYQVMFTAWGVKADGFYHATVWDDRTHGYVDLVAGYDAFAPGNPTNTPVIWLWRPGNRALEIRCWGGEAQG